MATEDIRIDGGRLTVERAEHKENVDVELADVEQVYFERSPDPTADGALVLTTADGKEHLIRVANDDVDEALSTVYDAWKPSEEEAIEAPTQDGEPIAPPRKRRVYAPTQEVLTGIDASSEGNK